MSKPSLAICTCSSRLPQWSYAFSLPRMMAGGLGDFERATLQVELGYATDHARMRTVRNIKKEGYTHIIFIDDDMNFPQHTASQLLKHGKQIIAANYTSRVFPVVPLAGKGGQRVISKGKTGIEQVDFAPTGVMMIETAIFDSIPLPWFQTTFIPETPDDFMSDDVWFCNLARKHGFEVWVDHDLSQQIGHTGLLEYGHHLVADLPAPPSKEITDMCKEYVGEAA